MNSGELARQIWECYAGGDFIGCLAKTHELIGVLSSSPRKVIEPILKMARERCDQAVDRMLFLRLGEDCFRDWGSVRDPKMFFGLLNDYSWYNETAEDLNIRALSDLMAEGATHTLKVILWSRARETALKEKGDNAFMILGQERELAQAKRELLAFVENGRPQAQLLAWNYLAFLHRAFLRLASPETYADAWHAYGHAWNAAASEFASHPELATQKSSHEALVKLAFASYACVADTSTADIASPLTVFGRLVTYAFDRGNYLVPWAMLDALRETNCTYAPLAALARALYLRTHVRDSGFLRCWAWELKL